MKKSEWTSVVIFNIGKKEVAFFLRHGEEISKHNIVDVLVCPREDIPLNVEEHKNGV